MKHLFCPDCGNLLDLPGNEEFIQCQLCQSSQSIQEMEKHVVVTKSRANAFKSNQLLVEQEEEYSGAIIEEKCSKCGHPQMKFFTMQLRSADEGQTVFYNCLKCNYTYSLNS